MRPSSCGIVETIGHVDQHGGIGSNHLVAVRDARWNQQLPSPQRADVQRVANTEGGRFGAQIHQHHLQHALQRHPTVGLVAMEVKRLDRAGIAERRRNLRGLFRKSQPGDLVPCARSRGNSRDRPAKPDRDGSGRPRSDLSSPAPGSLCRYPSRRWVLPTAWPIVPGPPVRAPRNSYAVCSGKFRRRARRLVSATRFPARSSESNVPASVHQPSRCAYVIVPSRM